MSRFLHIALGLCLAPAIQAQVELDVPLQFTGTPDQRGIDGLSEPSTNTSAMRVDGALLGTVQWGLATGVDQSILLDLQPNLSAYRSGLLLRFLAPLTVHGALTLACVDLLAYPVLRPDGLPPAHGQIQQGRVCEVLFADDRWILLSAPEKGCPPGSVAVQENLCIEIQDFPGLRFYEAGDRCMALGGKLCTWDEHFLACSTVSDQLLGLFNEWEWIDDGANHDHTADQVAFPDCIQHRSAILQAATGDTRCCFHVR